MAYWAAAQLQPQRDGLAVLNLKQRGFEIYAPRLRERRPAHGRVVERTPLLFPSYLFIRVFLQWHEARWAPGVVRLVMNGASPAAVPDGVIAALKARETDGLINLPRPPKFRPGDRVRVRHGAFTGLVGLYAGMKPRERVEVLLAILGGQRRLTLWAGDVEVV